VSKDELAGVQEVGVAKVPGQLVAKEPESVRVKGIGQYCVHAMGGEYATEKCNICKLQQARMADP
jgi:hypothetical protein